MFKDTRECNAMFYLDENGHELDVNEFVHENVEWHGLMLYVGGGFVPLAVAVLTCDARGFYRPDWGSAASTFEEWCRNNGRLDEIGEDNPDDEYFGEYELVIEEIPTHPYCKME